MKLTLTILLLTGLLEMKLPLDMSCSQAIEKLEAEGVITYEIPLTYYGGKMMIGYICSMTRT